MTGSVVLLGFVGFVACSGADKLGSSARAPAPVEDAGAVASAAPVASTPPLTAEQPTVTAQPPSTPAEPPAFVLRYACDDKYADERECGPGKVAWRAWLAELELPPGAASLLDHRGGGPSGAEWNPAAPLVAFVASAEPGRAILQLAAGKARPPVARFGNYDVFFVSFASWDKAARPARAGDVGDGVFHGISVVELNSVGTDGQRLNGTFAFSHGE